MSAFDESGVLIPAATLEDFPSDLSDCDARSLLAAWTVLWHPSLLAAQGQIPTWYRADAPPDPVGRRILTVPHPSLAQLPERYEAQCRQSEECQWITGADRQEMLAALSLGDAPPPLQGKDRSICVEDFFAVGFAILQIQVMTRRLRYTSNLDEIHLQNRVVAAAKAFEQRDGDSAVEAMHDVFDCLAEERDHYFASDPHLIDLILMTDTTIDALLQLADFGGQLPGSGTSPGDDPAANPVAADAAIDPPGETKDPSDSRQGLGAGDSRPRPLATPMNVLIDQTVALAISKLDRERREPLSAALVDGTLGWAGGGPATDTCFDAMTFRQAESVLRSTFLAAQQAIGRPPTVYARFSGSTPSDMTGTLVRLGYQGLIPLDFSGGTGFGDEAKVILREGGAEIESLTAKPLDASCDSAFLSLGARLGEAIDSGEIATALLAHWPGHGCDSYHDLRRVASWSLALGKFWKLDDYFRDGEHPYHHGNSRATSPDAAAHLTGQVASGVVDPLSTAAADFRQAVVQEGQSKLVALTSLISGSPGNQTSQTFAEAIGRQRSEDKRALLLINPHSTGCRETVSVEGPVAKSSEHIYGVSNEGKTSIATADIPACGFAVVQSDEKASSGRFSIGKMLGIGAPKLIAEQHHLRNEFMEVSISPESGGVAGVYSGGTRGNRFSMRLVRSAKDRKSESVDTTMRCDNLRIVSSTPAAGTIEVDGEILDGSDNSIAKFKLAYTLLRGSRILSVCGELTAIGSMTAEPWQSYLAARVAVVTEASICRLLLRDKVHRVPAVDWCVR